MIKFLVLSLKDQFGPISGKYSSGKQAQTLKHLKSSPIWTLISFFMHMGCQHECHPRKLTNISLPSTYTDCDFDLTSVYGINTHITNIKTCFYIPKRILSNYYYPNKSSISNALNSEIVQDTSFIYKELKEICYSKHFMKIIYILISIIILCTQTTPNMTILHYILYKSNKKQC